LDDDQFAACLQAARHRDELAITALYDQFATRVHAYLFYRIGDLNEADDLVEDVFLRMLEAIGSCRAQTKASFAAWMFRIAHNMAVNWFKQRSRHPVEALTEALPDPSDAPGDQVEQRLSYQRLRQAMAGLTDDQREVVLLRFVGGMSSMQVAQVIHTSEGAVKALQHRALATLRRALTHDEGAHDEG
jgi:RNA polymerase sigma-70 factor (ECF subfamily)